MLVLRPTSLPFKIKTKCAISEYTQSQKFCYTFIGLTNSVFQFNFEMGLDYCISNETV